MTRIIKHVNNFSTTLGSNLTNVATSMSVASATGLPTIGTNEGFYLTISAGANIEIVLVTAVSGTTLTIVRGQQGTSGTSFNSGDAVEMRATADSFDNKDSTYQTVNQSSHGFSVGDVLRLSGANTYTEAQADSAANAEVVGVVGAVQDTNNFTLVTAGKITGLSGLTANEVYFLDPSTAGATTTTEPSTADQISRPVYVADSTTSAIYLPYRGVTVGGKIAVSDLADGTDGELITWDASGNPTTVAVGTSGQVLTSNGAGAAPTFQAAAGGTSASAKVRKTTAQSINNSTATLLTWDSEDFDTDTIHDTSSNTSRLTATTAGKYLLIANIVFSSNNTGNRQILIYKNGSSTGDSLLWGNSGGGEDQTLFTSLYDLSSSDYLECYVWQDSGTSINVTTSSSFSMAKIDD